MTISRVRPWVGAIIWMAVIFAFSSRPSVSVSDEGIINFLFFKTIHVLEYAVLFILVFRGAKDIPKTFIISLLYALSDEIHQRFVPTREGRLRDVIIDAIGMGIAWIFLHTILPRLPRKLATSVGRLL